MAEYKYKYNPNRSAQWNYGGEKWKLSRSKIDFFFECQRCFYVDNVLGTKRPGFPSFNLNIAVDELFKNEFDGYRKTQTPHPIMEKYKIDAVPFAHKDLDTWRDPFVAIMHTHEPTGMVVSGGVDDIWMAPNGELIIVDYKATSKDSRIDKLGDSPWEKQYTRQLGVYKWLLEQNGFTVQETGYLVYANADKSLPEFGDTLRFETTVIPVPAVTDWIEPTLVDIKACLDRTDIPPIGENCEFCPYREACGKKLLAIHNSQKKTNMSGFTLAVKKVVHDIPVGTTMTYKEVAIAAGNPHAARAVANIMAANYDLDIPCHRVIRSDGGLGGYNRGGITVKKKLLIAEGAVL